MPDNKTKNQPIGVFDSGVGGLSILRELKRLLPGENFVFLADQFYVPYGEKSQKELVDRCLKVADFLVKKHDIKMLIVACNTATCGAIDELRSKHSFPIVGTVPAIKTAAQKTTTKNIAVISTPYTAKSRVVESLISEHCKDLNVCNIGCKGLENAVEDGDLDSADVVNLLQKYLKDVQNSNTDCLVLGCTHYPFLKKTITGILGTKIKLLDSGKAIARRAQNLLREYAILNKRKLGSVLYLTTGDLDRFEEIASKLLKEKIKASKIKI